PTASSHFTLSLEETEEWIKGYSTNLFFKNKGTEALAEEGPWNASSRFFRECTGLLFFRDADFQPKICVPLKKRHQVLQHAHKSPFSTAH
ncbi:hypothetical protein HYDPIDRAFT_59462, partial [Hydnomerulius pinastri MD-312]